MNTNTRIGIASVSAYFTGCLAGYLVSRKFHKKDHADMAAEIMEEVVPSMFQTMTMMFTGLQELMNKEFHEGMTDDEFMDAFVAAYEKRVFEGIEFFNLTMKDKYGVGMQLEIHHEPAKEE